MIIMTNESTNHHEHHKAAVDTALPGAYAMKRIGEKPAQQCRVVIPPSVQSGQEFYVQLQDRRVKIKCPPHCQPGQQLQITMPPEPILDIERLHMANVMASNNNTTTQQPQQQQNKKPRAFLVTIPPSVYPGMQFTIDIQGQRYKLTCPPNVGPNMKVKIVPPVPKEEQQPNSSSNSHNKGHHSKQQQQHAGTTCGWGDNLALEGATGGTPTQMFEVVVPKGITSGQNFALKANGQRVLVTCPPNVQQGQKIRFQLPVTQRMVKNIQLSYGTNNNNEGDGSADVKGHHHRRTSSVTDATIDGAKPPGIGWMRTIRATDMKFQWVRVNGEEEDSNNNNNAFHNHDNDSDSPLRRFHKSCFLDMAAMDKFDFAKSAYCRQLTFTEGPDPRIRTGTLEWVPAKEAVVDSQVAYRGHVLVSYSDIATAQGKQTLDDKIEWWETHICQPLLIPYEEGFVKLVIRRDHLLNDSVHAVMSLSRVECRKKWRLEFVKEKGLDAGGLTREWFQLVTEQIYDPAFGLWQSASSNNQGCVSIQANSAISCPEDHLVYFRFLGRILGRALLDRQLICKGGHMARHFYKHLLGFPITFEDLAAQDDQYYQNLKQLADMGTDIEHACLDFTVTEEQLGAHTQVELIPGGANVEVTVDNLDEYLTASLRYRMMDRVKPQLTELLLGFFDVVPEPALTVFDANELELLLCGLPTIDLDDWEKFTAYGGCFKSKGPHHKVCKWFWEVVREDFDPELRARLLQFVTGTSSVPSRGFSVLQGYDGQIRPFTLHGTDPMSEENGGHNYPRAHTCFNRLDLPRYKSKQELREMLKVVVTVSHVGFDMD